MCVRVKRNNVLRLFPGRAIVSISCSTKKLIMPFASPNSLAQKKRQAIQPARRGAQSPPASSPAHSDVRSKQLHCAKIRCKSLPASANLRQAALASGVCEARLPAERAIAEGNFGVAKRPNLIPFYGRRRVQRTGALHSTPETSFPVCGEKNLRAGHGVGKGFMVIERDPEFLADIGEFGGTDVPGAARNLHRAMKRQRRRLYSIGRAAGVQTPLSNEELCATRNFAPAMNCSSLGQSVPKSSAFATSFQVKPWI